MDFLPTKTCNFLFLLEAFLKDTSVHFVQRNRLFSHQRADFLSLPVRISPFCPNLTFKIASCRCFALWLSSFWFSSRHTSVYWELHALQLDTPPPTPPFHICLLLSQSACCHNSKYCGGLYQRLSALGKNKHGGRFLGKMIRRAALLLWLEHLTHFSFPSCRLVPYVRWADRSRQNGRIKRTSQLSDRSTRRRD